MIDLFLLEKEQAWHPTFSIDTHNYITLIQFLSTCCKVFELLYVHLLQLGSEKPNLIFFNTCMRMELESPTELFRSQTIYVQI